MPWLTKKLEGVCERIKIEKAPVGTVPYIEIGDINVENKKITLKEKGAVKGSIFAPAKCIIVSRVRPIRGAVALLDKKIAISSAFAILQPKPILDLKFLFYYLAYNPNFFEYLGIKQKGSNYPSCREKDILNFEIPLPPLKIQKQIVARIEELFEKIDKAKKLREKAKEETEQIFSSALQEVFSKAEKKWEARKLSDPTIAEVIMGQSPPSSTYNNQGNGLPFYQGKVDFSEIYLKPPQKWCSKPTKVALKNDVLISVRAPVGPTNICKEKSCIGRGLAAIRAKENLDNFYLFYWFRYNEPEIVNFGQGSTFGAIKKDYLENLEIPLPPFSEQKKIVNYLDTLREKVEKLKQLQQGQSEELTELKQSILAKAFKGELK